MLLALEGRSTSVELAAKLGWQVDHVGVALATLSTRGLAERVGDGTRNFQWRKTWAGRKMARELRGKG